VFPEFLIAKARQEEMLRRADQQRRARARPIPPPRAEARSEVTLRLARPEDGIALGALAKLLENPEVVLVADVDGHVVAGCPLDGLSSFGRLDDPWVGDLLALRATQLRRVRRRAFRFRRRAQGGLLSRASRF
jgi:hypothetical protein